MAGTWECELTDWQRAGFCAKENAPHSNLDLLRMKLTHLELEYLKDASSDVLSPTTHMYTDHLVEYRRQLLTSTTSTSVSREWSSGLKLETIVQLDAVKKYKERADAEAIKFKSELFSNPNPASIDNDPKDIQSPRSPELIPDHHRAKNSFMYKSAATRASSDDYKKTTPTRSQGVFSSGRPQWPQRKRPRPDDDDCVVIDDSEQSKKDSSLGFVTARDQYIINRHKKGCGEYDRTRQQINTGSYGGNKRSLGARRNVGNKFIPPVKGDEDDNRVGLMRAGGGSSGAGNSGSKLPPELEGDERLKNIEPRMVEMIVNEIMDHSAPVHWDDIAGLQFAKNTIKEIVVFPMLRPDIFTGLRGPPKGILLFGPPGTGKTLIGKCIASQAGATFFSISASSLTSKWIGEGEKMVRALFAVAQCYEPAVIFIDEIDSLLSQRSDSEHEATRRMKTEFLIKLDGVTVATSDRILLVGATNRPQEIDEAARRRLVKRLYIPLPDTAARKQIVKNLMQQERHSLSDDDIDDISQQTDGYSGADMASLCSEAAMGPIRSISVEEMKLISPDQVRPIVYQDFTEALSAVRPSVSVKDLEVYEKWNKLYGCGR